MTNRTVFSAVMLVCGTVCFLASLGAATVLNIVLRQASASAYADPIGTIAAGMFTGLVAGSFTLGLLLVVLGLRAGAGLPIAFGMVRKVEKMVRQLEALKAKGVLSEEEFQAKKAEVLARTL